MNKVELREILEQHKLWIESCCVDGKQADLSKMDLSNMDLSWKNLSEADLSEADLSEADLSGADLSGAYLRRANLYKANLSGADLSKANLSGADLSAANLRVANLAEADLLCTNFCKTQLLNTVLDSENKPNGLCDDFEIVDGFAIGYRTRRAGYIDKYRDCRYYSADVFSTCPQTECHPGLYLWPSIDLAKQWSPHQEIIRVRTKPSEIHKAGSKYRCRWFEVIGGVK